MQLSWMIKISIRIVTTNLVTIKLTTYVDMENLQSIIVAKIM